uniref:Uncharacterized protein n=1 Tax=Rhizophora mucronata TaxID=61149 RepID=A0A2P2N1W5_RHIMU
MEQHRLGSLVMHGQKHGLIKTYLRHLLSLRVKCMDHLHSRAKIISIQNSHNKMSILILAP